MDGVRKSLKEKFLRTRKTQSTDPVLPELGRRQGTTSRLNAENHRKEVKPDLIKETRGDPGLYLLRSYT